MGAPLGAPAGSEDCNLLKVLVGARGFEPPTPWSRTRCSTRLSHAPTRSTDAEPRQPKALAPAFDSAKKYSTLVVAFAPEGLAPSAAEHMARALPARRGDAHRTAAETPALHGRPAAARSSGFFL